MIESIHDVPGVYLALAFGLILLAATEVGYRMGQRVRRDLPSETRPVIGTVQGSVLGLLALLLGFSFAMSGSRFEVRKQVVLDEANALGTAYLRSQLLPQPQRAEAADKVRKYVSIRIKGYHTGATHDELRATDRELVQLQGQIWTLASEAVERDPKAVGPGMFAASMNDVIDLHEKRVTALENHVPTLIVVVLLVAASSAMGLTGYGCGLGGARNFVPTTMIVVLVSVVLWLILDLDRPGRGLIRVGQASFQRLEAGMAK